MNVLIFLAAPLTMAFLLVGIHSYLGLHVLKRDVIFIDIGLSQVAALGAAISHFFVAEGEGYLSYVLALLGTIIVSLLLAYFRQKEKRISQEVLIGMTYALASGLFILVADRLPHGTEHLKHALTGDLLFVTWKQVMETALIYVFVGCVHFMFFKPFWLSSTGQIQSFKWDFLFYVLFGLVITFSTHHAGVLVVFAVLVAPAALATKICKGGQARSLMVRQLLVSWVIGMVGVSIAFALSYLVDVPAGAGIVAVLSLLFFGALLIWPKEKSLAPPHNI